MCIVLENETFRKDMESPFSSTASARDESRSSEYTVKSLTDLKYIGHGRSATEIWGQENTVNIDLGDETNDLHAQGTKCFNLVMHAQQA